MDNKTAVSFKVKIGENGQDGIQLALWLTALLIRCSSSSNHGLCLLQYLLSEDKRMDPCSSNPWCSRVNCVIFGVNKYWAVIKHGSIILWIPFRVIFILFRLSDSFLPRNYLLITVLHAHNVNQMEFGGEIGLWRPLPYWHLLLGVCSKSTTMFQVGWVNFPDSRHGSRTSGLKNCESQLITKLLEPRGALQRSFPVLLLEMSRLKCREIQVKHRVSGRVIQYRGSVITSFVPLLMSSG